MCRPSLQKPDSVYDTVALRVISSFPNSLSINAQDVIDAYGGAFDFTEFDAGDRLNIVSTTTNAQGTTFTTDDFTGDLSNPGQRQAFDYTVFFSCPFVRDDALGNYLITNDPFVTSLDYSRPIEAIAGAGDTEVVFLKLFSHPEMYDVAVSVDAATGVATVEKQEAWNCDNFGCAFGVGSVEGTGFFFSCTGFLTVDLENTVAAGSFGTFNLVVERQ